MLLVFSAIFKSHVLETAYSKASNVSADFRGGAHTNAVIGRISIWKRKLSSPLQGDENIAHLRNSFPWLHALAFDNVQYTSEALQHESKGNFKYGSNNTVEDVAQQCYQWSFVFPFGRRSSRVAQESWKMAELIQKRHWLWRKKAFS